MRQNSRGRLMSVAVTLLLLSSLQLPSEGKGSEWDTQITAGAEALARGDYSQGATSLEAALQLTSKFQTNDPRLGQTYYELGELRAKQGDWNEAKQYYQRALNIQQKTPPGDRPEIGNTIYGLATACEQTRDYQEAVIHLRRVLEIWSKQYGASDPRLVDILASMATYATLDSDYPTAEECYRRIVSIQERSKGRTSSRYGASLNLLAGCMAHVGKYKEAAPLAKEAVDILSATSDSPTSLDSAIATLRYVEQNLGTREPYIPPAVAKAISATTIAKIVAPESSGQTKVPDAVPPTHTEPKVATVPPTHTEPKVATVPPTHTEPKVATVPPTHTEPKVATVPPTHAEPKVATVPTHTVVVVPPTHTDTKVASVPPITEPKVISTPPTHVDTKVAMVPPATEPKVISTPPTHVDTKVATVPPTTAPKVISTPPTKVATTPPSKAGTSGGSNSDSIKIASNSGTQSSTQVVMRPPQSSTPTTSAEFRPWEGRDSGVQVSSKLENANWGKTRYLAGGHLISPDQYKAMLLANEAYELIRTEKYLMSIDILQKALAIYPEMSSGHSNLGLALSQLGRYDEAIENLRQAIAIDHSKPGAWLNLASAFQMSGKLKESVATYGEFAREFPNEPLAVQAKDLVRQLNKEILDQEAVALASSSKAGDLNDYFAYASHSSKVRWPGEKQTIKVYVSTGTGVPGFKPEYAGFFHDSFNQWSAACKDRINFEFVKKPDASDIECMWTNDINKVSSPAEGGETTLTHDGKVIKHATITVLTAGPTADSPLSPTQVRAICLHEIGHALGLVGHSPKPTDVMYCSVPPANAKVGITDRDTSTIQRLYSSGDVTIGLLNRSANFGGRE